MTVNLGLAGAQNTNGAGSDILMGIEDLVGSQFGDRLTGNALEGGGSNDSLNGGAGADAFKFWTTSEGTDRITDLTSGSDKIEVVSANFGALPVGALAASRFKAAGTPLTNGNAVFIYNAATGALSFDSNGNGAGGVSQIAILTGPKTLVASDIQVVSA